MPEIRRRGTADQFGVPASRTMPGVRSGGGLAPIVERLAASPRARTAGRPTQNESKVWTTTDIDGGTMVLSRDLGDELGIVAGLWLVAAGATLYADALTAPDGVLRVQVGTLGNTLNGPFFLGGPVTAAYTSTSFLASGGEVVTATFDAGGYDPEETSGLSLTLTVQAVRIA